MSLRDCQKRLYVAYSVMYRNFEVSSQYILIERKNIQEMPLFGHHGWPAAKAQGIIPLERYAGKQ